MCREWTEDNTQQTISNDFRNLPLLQCPDFNKSLNLTTDACNVALDAALCQAPTGRDLVVAYHMRQKHPNNSE